MSTKTILICDFCKREDISHIQTINIEYDRGLYGGSPSPESFYYKIDICPICLAKKLNKIIHNMDYKDRLPSLGIKDQTADGRER